MPNLRDLIDGKAADVMAKSDVFNHLKDVKDKQNAVDVATLKLHNKLAPARQMIQMVDQQHPMPGQENQQQQFDSQGNPLPMPQMNQQQPGMQMNPNSAQQNTNQKLKQDGQQPVAGQKKPAFGNTNKTSTKDKMENDQNNKSKKKQVGGKKGLELHIKAEDDEEMVDQMNVKKSKKKLHGRFDYHDNPGKDEGAGRGMGLSGGGPGSGRHPGSSKPFKGKLSDSPVSKPAHAGLHNVLIKSGYKMHDSDGKTSNYHH